MHVEWTMDIHGLSSFYSNFNGLFDGYRFFMHLFAGITRNVFLKVVITEET